MPERMTPEDWEAQQAFANAMTPEERDKARADELTRQEARDRLAAKLERERLESGVGKPGMEALSAADVLGETYRRIREEGRTKPEEVRTVRGLSDELSGPGAAAEGAPRPSPTPRQAGIPVGPPMTPNWTADGRKVVPIQDVTLKPHGGGEPIKLGDGSMSFGAGTEGPEPAMLPFEEEQKREPTKALQKWADVAMWQAPAHDDPQSPKVFLTVAPEDPLGIMAMVNGMYTGKVYRSPSEVSDAERREAWEAGAVSLLSQAPLEWFQISLLFENVSRAFTHQLVRQRMAGYAQESMRFAVKEDAHDAVKLPPSLAGTLPAEEFYHSMEEQGLMPEGNTPPEQRWRLRWDEAIEYIAQTYGVLVNDGMPAEDARGILPTNILTRIHEHVDMGTLLKMAGTRLCTQAQFEWRAVFAQLVQALREYLPEDHPNRWQYELIAERFRPVCFSANKCTMKAKSDRHCSIREQVDAYERNGVKSEFWEDPMNGQVGIKPIRPEQWLADPTAARVAP